MELNLQHVLSYNPIVTMYGIVSHKKSYNFEYYSSFRFSLDMVSREGLLFAFFIMLRSLSTYFDCQLLARYGAFIN